MSIHVFPPSFSRPLNPNGGDDTAIVTNVLSTTHSTWVVDPAVHPATGPQPPTYRKKVHGSRAALCRHIAEQTFVPRYEQTFVPRYDPKPGEVEIVTSCSIADVLPTMEESMHGNFDIVLDRFARASQLHANPRALCGTLYFSAHAYRLLMGARNPMSRFARSRLQAAVRDPDSRRQEPGIEARGQGRPEGEGAPRLREV